MKFNRGIALGGAYRHDFNQQITNYQREDALERARRSEQRAQMKMAYEGLEEMPDVIGQFDQNQLREKYEGAISGVGEFIKNNPNYDTDPEAYAELQKIKHGFTNDADVRRAITATDQYKQWQDFMARNPDANREEMENIRQSWMMYNKTGTMDGVTPNAFTFVNPGKAFNMENYLLQFGKGLKTNTIQYDQVGAYGTVDTGTLRTMARELLNGDSNESFQIKAQLREMIAEGKLPENTNPIDYVAAGLQRGIGKQYNAAMTTAAAKANEAPEQPKAEPYRKVWETPVNRFPKEQAGILIDWDDKKETVTFDDSRTPVLVTGIIKDTADMFEGSALRSELQMPIEVLRGREFRAKPSGTIAQIAPGLMGVETTLSIDATKDSAFEEIISYLEQQKSGDQPLVENNDHTWLWGSDVDPEEYKFANDNLFFGTRKGDDGEDIPTFHMKILVPKEYNEDYGLKFNQYGVSKTDTYGNIQGTQSQKIINKRINGQVVSFLADDSGNVLTDQNGNPVLAQ